MIWAIGDLHLDHKKEKPMSVFGKAWEDHENKIFDAWNRRVKADDHVLVVGDISWALKLEEGVEDLKRLDDLPGRKILIKGNHDYWWSSLNKLNQLGLRSIDFLHNTGIVLDDIAVCGSRGWTDIDSNGFDEKDEKIYKRELNRLQLSIDDMNAKCEGKDIRARIAMLHYPPFSSKGEPNDFADILRDAKIDYCVYGHLHSYGHKFIVEGDYGGVEYRCVSSDYVNFTPQEIEV
ncbi:MAG: metallophosphoesterase [Peptoniphilus sp.]|nr:metallophosphoesterase [Peptoniphilus sp.]MDD7363097.1 metallophosphoesterase [Bacillota bacterium]MDY6044381.1 metallophosphoesterase [Peptoniphilus sp.]